MDTIVSFAAQRSSGKIMQASINSADQSDEYFDFSPTAHPARELFTFSFFVPLAVWGGSKLISLIATWLI
jgi:hypothetical protein